jgi:hypothetical protein
VLAHVDQRSTAVSRFKGSLELRDALRQGWLRHVDLAGRPTEVKLFRHRQELSPRSQIDDWFFHMYFKLIGPD